MIEILKVKIIVNDDGLPSVRHADIIISDGNDSYLWGVGGLPLEGDLQAILDARFDELWAAASVRRRPVDLYEITAKRVLKAFALVVLDEINILRQQHGLAQRTAGQIEDAIKNKLKGMV